MHNNLYNTTQSVPQTSTHHTISDPLYTIYTVKQIETAVIISGHINHKLHHRLYGLQQLTEQYNLPTLQHTESIHKLPIDFDTVNNDIHRYTNNKLIRIVGELLNNRKYSESQNLISCNNPNCQCKTRTFQKIPLHTAMQISNCTLTYDTVVQLSDIELQAAHHASDNCTNPGLMCDLDTSIELQNYKSMHEYIECVEIMETIHPVRLLTPPHHTAFGMRAKPRKQITATQLIGFYTGELISAETYNKQQSALGSRHIVLAAEQIYTYEYKAALGVDLMCCALKQGNELRYINDSNFRDTYSSHTQTQTDVDGNVEVAQSWNSLTKLPQTLLYSKRKIKGGEELVLTNYTKHYWFSMYKLLLIEHYRYQKQANLLIDWYLQQLRNAQVYEYGIKQAKNKQNRCYWMNTVYYPKRFGQMPDPAAVKSVYKRKCDTVTQTVNIGTNKCLQKSVQFDNNITLINDIMNDSDCENDIPQLEHGTSSDQTHNKLH